MNEYHITTCTENKDIVYGHVVRINENGDLMIFERLPAGQHDLLRAYSRSQWLDIVRFKEGDDA